MEHQLQTEIALGNQDAMLKLAQHYKRTNNFVEMEKCYMTAIELNNDKAMVALGCHYEDIKEYKKMKTYFRMAVALKNTEAMNYLANYYRFVVQNFPRAKQYYLMAINHGCKIAVIDLDLFEQQRLKNIVGSIYNLKQCANTCSICQDVLCNVVSVECNHEFCQECIKDWQYSSTDCSQTTCPHCRALITNFKEIEYI